MACDPCSRCGRGCGRILAGRGLLCRSCIDEIERERKLRADLEGLATRLERLPEVEKAAYHTEPREWVEVIVEDDRLGPRVLLIVAIHRAGVEECIPTGDGEYRAATLR